MFELNLSFSEYISYIIIIKLFAQEFWKWDCVLTDAENSGENRFKQHRNI